METKPIPIIHRNYHDPVEQLDKVLTFMVTSWATTGRIESSRIQSELKVLGYEIGGGDLHDVIEQLLQDGYIEKKVFRDTLMNVPYFTYRATWAGKYFQMTSGYKKKIQKIEKEENDRKLYLANETAQNRRMESIQTQNVELTKILAWTALVVCIATVLQLFLSFVKELPFFVFQTLIQIIF